MNEIELSLITTILLIYHINIRKIKVGPIGNKHAVLALISVLVTIVSTSMTANHVIKNGGALKLRQRITKAYHYQNA